MTILRFDSEVTGSNPGRAIFFSFLLDREFNSESIGSSHVILF